MKKNSALKISVIGSGRLGQALAYAINAKNSEDAFIVSVANRSSKPLKAAEELLKGSSRKILFTQDNKQAAIVSNCIFICTPDGEIENVCSEIFEQGSNAIEKKAGDETAGNLKTEDAGNRMRCDSENYTVVHFCGSKKTDVLGSAEKAGASVACIHPLKSFASAREAAETLDGTLYGVTYDTKNPGIKKTVDFLLQLLKGRSMFVENKNKTLYHACACITSNYLVSLADFAADAGTLAGLDMQVFSGGLAVLSESTLSNIKRLGTKKALTGPIARGDICTIMEHMEAIKALGRDDIVEMYRLMGEKAAKISLENTWINDKTYSDLIKILQDK